MDSDNTKPAQEAANALLRALEPALAEATASRGKDAYAALVSLARPFLRQALLEVELAGVEVDVTPDKRMSEYHVTAMFWDIDDGPDQAELIELEETPEARVFGMAEALRQLSDWIAELHEGEELSEDAYQATVLKRTATLKTALMRGNGQAAFRIFYEADGFKHLCHATVTRAELMGEDDE